MGRRATRRRYFWLFRIFPLAPRYLRARAGVAHAG